jgi:hypothetical protein
VDDDFTTETPGDCITKPVTYATLLCLLAAPGAEDTMEEAFSMAGTFFFIRGAWLADGDTHVCTDEAGDDVVVVDRDEVRAELRGGAAVEVLLVGRSECALANDVRTVKIAAQLVSPYRKALSVEPRGFLQFAHHGE